MASAHDNQANAAKDGEIECVIALHGLARTAASMEKMAEELAEHGYRVANVDYPSREKTVEELAAPAIQEGLETCQAEGASRVHFVTHSMGGILVRQYMNGHTIENLGRVVMLAPPNQGSEVVDALRDTPGFEAINGPAGMQLGTKVTDVPRSLGPVAFDLGVIAGTRSINLVLSTYLPDPDDGKVSVDSAQVEGMCDFLALPVSHPFIMRDDDVIAQVIHYYQSGFFKDTEAEDNAGKTATTVASDELPAHCTPR